MQVAPRGWQLRLWVWPEQVEAKCRQVWEASCAQLRKLGFVPSQGFGTTEAPGTRKVCLGLEVESVSMAVFLGAEKLVTPASLCLTDIPNSWPYFLCHNLRKFERQIC